ncbi:hypothetical protein D3C76_1173710 [compost metagenome]
MLGDLVDIGDHLLHRRRHAGGAVRLLARALHHALRSVVQAPRGLAQLLAFGPNGLDHLPQIVLHVRQGLLQLAGLIITVDGNDVTQVALGNRARDLDALLKRPEYCHQ